MKKFVVMMSMAMFAISAWAQTEGDPNRIQGWVMVYEADANGNLVSGSLSTLAGAIRAGAEVRIVFDSGSYDISLDCERVWVNKTTDHCACLDMDYVGLSILDGDVDFQFVSDQYKGYYTFNTKGQSDLTRWSVGQHVNKGDDTYALPMKWFVKLH